jgi:hypothetical protein
MVILSAESAPGVIGFDAKNLLMLTPGKLVKDASTGSILDLVEFGHKKEPLIDYPQPG